MLGTTADTYTGGWTGINTVNATNIGDSLSGENAVSTWTIGTAPYTYDDGAGFGTLAFSKFETLNGGSLADTFNVSTDDTTSAQKITNITGGAGMTCSTCRPTAS